MEEYIIFALIIIIATFIIFIVLFPTESFGHKMVAIGGIVVLQILAVIFVEIWVMILNAENNSSFEIEK